MAVYNNMLVTNEGKKQYAKVMAGSTITFTKVAFGSGNPASQAEAEALTALKEQKIVGSIESIDTTTTAGIAIVTVQVNNSTLENLVAVKEIGLFARVGSEAEAMYAYCFSSNDIDVIPSSASGSVTWKMRLQLAITNATVGTTQQDDLLDHAVVVTPITTDGTVFLTNVVSSCKYRVKGNNTVTAFYEITGKLTNVRLYAETKLTSVTISLPQAAAVETPVFGRMIVPYTDNSQTLDAIVDVTGTIEAGSSVISLDYIGSQDGDFTLLLPVTYYI